MPTNKLAAVCKKRPAATSPAPVLKRPSRSSESADVFIGVQIYLPGERKHLTFSRVKSANYKKFHKQQDTLTARFEDEAWSAERLKREFLHLASLHR